MEDKRVPALIAAIVVALVVIGGFAWRYFGSGPGYVPTRALTAEEKSAKEWMEQKARETGGDFDKLSPEDRRKAIAMNGPKAPFELRQVAKSLPPKP